MLNIAKQRQLWEIFIWNSIFPPRPKIILLDKISDLGVDSPKDSVLDSFGKFDDKSDSGSDSAAGDSSDAGSKGDSVDSLLDTKSKKLDLEDSKFDASEDSGKKHMKTFLT